MANEKKVLVRQAVAAIASDYRMNLERAFEEVGCSCNPLRKELKELQTAHSELTSELYNRLQKEKQQADTRHQRAVAALDKEPRFKRLKALEGEVQKRDRAEHPTLDRNAHAAAPFFRVWLYDQVSSGAIAQAKDPAHEFATAWMNGWRPTAEEVTA